MAETATKSSTSNPRRSPASGARWVAGGQAGPDKRAKVARQAARLFIPKGRARTKEACMVARQAARLFVPRAGQEPREPAWWRGKPRDCLSQGPGKNQESLHGGAASRAIVCPKGLGRPMERQLRFAPLPFHDPSQALGGRHSWFLPGPWGQALLVLARPLGGRHPLFLPGPLGCPFIRPCLPPCVVTFVNAFHVEHYICKCLQVQPLTIVNTSSVGWFTFVYRPVNQAVVAHLYAFSLSFLCSPSTFVNACRRNYPPDVYICQCLQVQLSTCRLHLSTARPGQGPAPGQPPPGPRPAPTRPPASPHPGPALASPHPGQGPA